MSVVAAATAMDTFAIESLNVPLGETATFNETTNFTDVTVHGTLNVIGGLFAVTNGSNTFVDLGPNAGDVGKMTVTNALLKEYTNYARISVRIGKDGGGDQAKLKIYKTPTNKGNSYLGEFLLARNAATSADRFEPLEIGEDGWFMVSQVKNDNAKPLVIAFTGNNARLGKFWSGKIFLTSGGGDIVLKSVDGADINLYGYWGAGVTINFFDSDQNNRKGLLRTEGTGNVILNIEGTGKGSITCLNAANVAWGHSGDLIIGTEGYSNYSIFQVTADDVLPYGAATGEVIVRSQTNKTKEPNIFDLCGTSQLINGLSGTNESVIMNTSPDEAVLVFGTGDTNGRIKDICLTNSAIRCEKTGSGTLTLDGAVLNTLSAGSGAIHVASKSYVDTFAITNVALTFAGGDSSLLEVREWRIGPSVTLPMPDGAATNSVFAFPAVPGASAATKGGANFVTYMTPVDAHGIALNVNGGVLRFGGAACANEFWRLVLKKAKIDGKTFIRADTGVEQFITVGLGSLGMYNGEGVSAIGSATTYGPDVAHDPDDAYLLSRGEAMSKNPVVVSSAADKILGGGYSSHNVDVLIGTPNVYSNSYDYPCVNGTDSNNMLVRNFAWSVLYDGSSCGGKALDPEDESTWEIVTWRMKEEWPKYPTSYAMRRTVNWGQDNPHLTDWALQSSPDGRAGTWITMDERSGQRWWANNEAGSSGLNQQFQFTYNNHIPYLFNSLNAGWRFTTFGPVSVAAGATLDLSNLRPENIAFNALKVDLAAGAGTITHFAPAADGALYLENATAEQLNAKSIRLPLAVGTMISDGNFASWRVFLDGVRAPTMSVEVEDGAICVRTHRGFTVIFK